MKITFLIGNGFDVGRGLKSRYIDFYERYTDETDLKPADWKLAGLAETINANRWDWSYYEEQLGEYTWGFSGKSDRFQVLLDQHGDFEHKFYIHLQEQMDKYFPAPEAQVEEILKEMKGSIKAVWDEISRSHAIVYELILRGQSREVAGNISWEMTAWAMNASLSTEEKKGKLKSLVKHVFAERVSRLRGMDSDAEVREYENKLDLDAVFSGEQYKKLESILAKLENDRKTAKKTEAALKREKEISQEMGCALKDVLREINALRKIEITNADAEFLCFNYSTALDQCLECLGQTYTARDPKCTFEIQKPIHVHGKIRPNHTGHCAMGVNDESQIRGRDVAKNKKVCAQLIKREYMSQVYADDGKTPIIERGKLIIEESDMIVVYGMSIGSTDKNWWEKIAKWLEEKKTEGFAEAKGRVFFYIHVEKGKTQKEKDDLEEEYREKLKNMSDIYKDPAIQEQLRFVLGKDIFGKGYSHS